MSFEIKRSIYLIIFIFTILIPLLTVPLAVKLGLIKSIEMDDHRERIIPLVNTIVSYLACSFFLMKLNLSRPVDIFVIKILVCGAITLMMCLFISYKWKISIHMTGIGGAIGATIVSAIDFFADMHIVVIALIILAGILGTSRLLLKAHSEYQLYSGFLLGFSVTLTSMLIL